MRCQTAGAQTSPEEEEEEEEEGILQALGKGGRGSCRGKYLVTELRGTLDAAGT